MIALNKLASPRGLVLEARHDVSKEADMDGIVFCVGMGACSSQMAPSARLAPHLEGPENGSVLTL